MAQLSKAEVIKKWCKLTGIAYHSREDYLLPADCFCGQVHNIFHDGFQFDGEILDYIHEAVVEKLQRDGKKITDEVTWKDN